MLFLRKYREQATHLNGDDHWFVFAENVHVSIKGNLNLESRQDSNHYDSKQTQAGAGFSVAIYGSGSS